MSRGLVDLRDWRLFRDVEQLHPHGARIYYEILAEIGASLSCRTEVEGIVRRFVTAFCSRTARR